MSGNWDAACLICGHQHPYGECGRLLDPRYQAEFAALMTYLSRREYGSPLSDTIYAVAWPTTDMGRPIWQYDTFGGGRTMAEQFATHHVDAQLLTRIAGVWQQVKDPDDITCGETDEGATA